MDFTNVPLLHYVLTALGGLGLGAFQSWLVKRAAMGEKPRSWLYALKFALWAAALAGVALISLPLLIVFVVTASLSLLVGSIIMYLRAQKEAR